MKRSLKSVAAVAIATLATAGLAVIAAPMANAATGTVSLNPTSGPLTGTPSFVPSAACSGTNPYTQAILSGGPNAWPASALWKAPSPVAQGFGVSDTIVGYANANAYSLANGNGTYDITFYCTNSGGTTIYDTFTGQLTIAGIVGSTTTAATYTVVDNTTPSAASTPTASPTTGVTTSTPVTLSTTVTAPTLAAGVTTGGTVQFQSNGANIGAAVPVTGLTNAAAGVTVSTPFTFTTPGAQSITAVFSGTAGVVKAATSGALSLTVAGPAANTSLALAASATSIDQLSNVVLTATATNLGTPAGATAGTPTGTVTFFNGATSLGTGTLNATGVATLAVSGATLGVGGPYNLTASLAASAGFNTSTSAAVPVTVTQAANVFNPVPAPQTIQTNVVAGTLTVSGGVTANSGNVTLGFPGIVDNGVTKYALQLNAANNLLTNNGAAATDGHNQLYRLLVTDSTAGNTGYKVNGVVASNFTSGANIIDSATLGWTPAVTGICGAGVLPSAPTFAAGTGPLGSGYETTETAPGNICSQVAATPGPAVVPGAPGTTAGLKTASLLYSTTAGASTGTVSATAGLLLNAPTTTKAGYYTTNLTLTALLN